MTHITASTYQEWADELNKLEDQVQAIQDAKKAVYARIRRDSKMVADGMKSALRLLRMEERKRAEAMLIEAEGRRIIELIKSGEHTASRAARERRGHRLFRSLESIARERGLSRFRPQRTLWRAAHRRTIPKPARYSRKCKSSRSRSRRGLS